MKELKPFGDVPDKLSVLIKRSFVATRTYGQALNSAADVSKRVVNVSILLASLKNCKKQNPFYFFYLDSFKCRLYIGFDKNATLWFM